MDKEKDLSELFEVGQSVFILRQTSVPFYAPATVTKVNRRSMSVAYEGAEEQHFYYHEARNVYPVTPQTKLLVELVRQTNQKIWELQTRVQAYREEMKTKYGI